MSTQAIANGIDDGSIPFLELTDEFDFNCHQCGTCCHDIDVLLNPWDVIKLHRELKIPTQEIMNYIHIQPGGRSKWPMVLLNMVEPRIKIPGRTRSACSFLKGGKCSVYKERPTVCRSYPIGRVSGRNQETNEALPERYILVPEQCAAYNAGVKHTVSDWIKEADLEDRWAKSREYDKVLMDLLGIKKIDMKELLADQLAYSILVNLLFNVDDQERSYVSIIGEEPTDEELYSFMLATSSVWASGLWKDTRDMAEAGDPDETSNTLNSQVVSQ